MEHKIKKIKGLSKIPYTVKLMMNKKIQSLPTKDKIALGDMLKAGKIVKHNNKYYSNSFMPPFPGKSFDRLIDSMQHLKKGKGVPISTFIAVTNQCPYDCWHCSYDKRINEDSLNLASINKLTSELQDLGTTVIGITGGEPLERKDLPEIISAIDDRTTVVMFTTGYGLTPELADKLKKAKLEMPIVSLDHYKPEIHDKLRGYEGAFDIALKAIDIFLKKGFYTALTLSPTKEMINTEGEIEKYFDFVKKLGVHEVRIAALSLSGKLLGKEEEKFNEDEMSFLRKINYDFNKTNKYPTVASFPLFESKEQFGCGAAYHHCFVDHLGNACPCDVSPLSFGNVKDESFKTLFDRMHKYFYLPGITCYSHKVSSLVMDKFTGTLPLNMKDSIDIVEQHPPRPEEAIPMFYEKMGLKINSEMNK